MALHPRRSSTLPSHEANLIRVDIEPHTGSRFCIRDRPAIICDLKAAFGGK
jgi:hypothetical protein